MNIKLIKRLGVIIFILLVIAIATKIYISRSVKVIDLENEDAFSKDKLVLVDSLEYSETSVLYRFTFDSGTFGQSGDFLVVCSNRNSISKSDAFFYSNSISSINKIGKDSILIKLIELDFHVDSTKTAPPFRVELEREGVDIPRSKRLNIHL